MNNKQDVEDDDDIIDSDAAASFRKMLMNQVRRIPNPLHQSLMELETLGEPFGIPNNYDTEDLSDISNDW